MTRTARPLVSLLRPLAVAGAALLGLSVWAPQAMAQANESRGGLIRDVEIEETLRDFATPLLKAAELDPQAVKIHIIDSPDINAFVSGGQQMFFHTGLIVAAKTPNELKAVMAHEIGHISGGDLPRARAAMRAAMGPALISIGLGVLAIMAGAPDAGVAIMSGSGQFAQASFVRHSRAEESAADQAGVKYLEATGQSPLGLVSFFEREFRDTEWLVRRAPLYVQTHPLPTDRLASLRAKVDKSPLRDKLDSPEDIARFEQMKAKLVGFLDDPRQISRIYPDTDKSIPARYARTVAAHRLKDMGSALSGVQGLISEQPNNPHFQELAAQILYERGRAKEALPYARKALELKPGTMLLEYNLARALYQADKTANAEEAITLLLSAQTREPDSPFVWAFLAEVYDSAGRGGEARLAWAEAQYWSNNFPRAKNFAERAKRELQPDTPAWRRADEISDMSETEIRAQGGRRRG